MDYETVIPDDFTQLRLRLDLIHGVQATYRNDVALWQIEFRNGTQAAPDRPAPPALSLSGTDTIEVSWVAPQDNGDAITSYDLRYRATGTSSWTDVSDETGLSYTIDS